MEENEVELMDHLKVIWKRKWIIIIPTLLCVVAVGVVSFLSPNVWEIDAIIAPSKFFVQTEVGLFEVTVVADPIQIAAQINQASYNSSIASELNLDIRRFPKLTAENIRNTNLVKVSLKERDIERAKRILHSLFRHLKKELDEKSEIEIKGIDTQIKTNEMERLNEKEEIAAFKIKFSVVRQRIKEIEQEMSEIKKRIELLKKEQHLSSRKIPVSEAESLAAFLHLSAIQQSLRNYNSLRELLSRKKIEIEFINLETIKRARRVDLIENKIDHLKERKSRIKFAQLIKKPTSSMSPVYPQKALNVLIAGILGLMVFTLLSFFLEYIEKHKTKT